MGTVWISCLFFSMTFSVQFPFDFVVSFLIFLPLVSFCLWVPPPPHCYTICYDSPKFMDPPTRIIFVVAVVAIIVTTIIITPTISIIVLITHARSPHAHFPSRLASTVVVSVRRGGDFIFFACDGRAAEGRGGADTLIYVDDTDGAGAGCWFAAPPRAVLFTVQCSREGVFDWL